MAITRAPSASLASQPRKTKMYAKRGTQHIQLPPVYLIMVSMDVMASYQVCVKEQVKRKLDKWEIL